ncbi:MAG: adenylate/guanylate cyclase domain-containing protein [Pseudomonadota bacterium]
MVDDHPTNRLKLAMAVQALGHEAEQAENGVVALEMMRSGAFDLILLDIVMPVMDGHAVLRVMQEDEDLRQIPVIVISASAEVADAIQCIQNGAEDYLPKPFDPVLLKARIGSSLAKKRLNDAIRKHMEFIRDILGKFVPDTVVNQIVESDGDLKPSRTLATVLMTDVVGFTQIVESNPPERVLEMLNSYFRAILDPITRHGGIVNNFEGDAVMALFNVPISDPDHADKAMQTALEINEITETQTFAGIRLPTRIGIDTGEVVAGNVGDGARLTYTVVGNTVNTAARLEELNKDLGSRVAVSGATIAQLKGAYPLQDAGPTTLRGLSDPIPISILDR